VNRSKLVGTAAESAVVKWLHLNGYPQARRLALAGNGDVGDVELNASVMLQVKAGHAAEKASDAQVAAWMAATWGQAVRGGYSQHFLVTKRAGKGRPSDWWCHTVLWDVVPVRFALGHLPVVLGAGVDA